MKLLTTIGAVCLASANLFAQSSFTYSVSGELKDNSYDGKMIYIFDYNKEANIDSVLVKGNKFVFNGKSNDKALCRVNVSKQDFANFVLEKGNISVDIEMKGLPAGTPLNDAFSSIQKKQLEKNKLFMAKKNELKAKFKDENMIQLELSKYYQEVMSGAPEEGKKLFAEHNNDPVGEYLFFTEYFPRDAAEQSKLIDSFGPWLKSRRAVADKLTAMNSVKNTAEGKKFADVTGKDINGATVSLSKYVGKGEYVLVDMWASWCGPCKREIPNIAKIYEKYKGKGLNVVGLFVWDKEANLKKAVEAEKAVWPQIIDTNNVVAKLYGVEGIPHIMLIGPDGTILKRDLRDQEMIDYVDSVMNKK